MRAMIALLCCMLVLPALGEETTVYKRVRPDGTIEFSDTAVPGSETVQVQQVPTYKAPPVSKPSPKKTESPRAEVSYTQITITSPVPDSTLFFDEQGTPVSVDVEPALGQGHVVTLYLDGQRVASGPSTSFTVKEIFRGSHTLTAVVEGPGRKELLRSQPVTFNMIQHSNNPVVPKKKSK